MKTAELFQKLTLTEGLLFALCLLAFVVSFKALFGFIKDGMKKRVAVPVALGGLVVMLGIVFASASSSYAATLKKVSSNEDITVFVNGKVANAEDVSGLSMVLGAFNANKEYKALYIVPYSLTMNNAKYNKDVEYYMNNKKIDIENEDFDLRKLDPAQFTFKMSKDGTKKMYIIKKGLTETKTA